MTILGKLEPREIEGADEVLEGVLAEFTSGNQCCIWPAMTYDSGLRQTRIAFFTGWRTQPSDADFQELVAYTDGLMGKSRDFATFAKGDPCTNATAVTWLATGEKPKVH